MPPALPRVSEARLRATVDALRGRGLYPVHDRDRQLIEGFTQLGLLCSVPLPREEFLRPFFAGRGLDLDRTLAAGNVIARRCGIGRIRVVNGYVLPMFRRRWPGRLRLLEASVDGRPGRSTTLTGALQATVQRYYPIGVSTIAFRRKIRGPADDKRRPSAATVASCG